MFNDAGVDLLADNYSAGCSWSLRCAEPSPDAICGNADIGVRRLPQVVDWQFGLSQIRLFIGFATLQRRRFFPFPEPEHQQTGTKRETKADQPHTHEPPEVEREHQRFPAFVFRAFTDASNVCRSLSGVSFPRSYPNMKQALRLFSLAFLLAVLVIETAAAPFDFHGKVIAIADGDTLRILTADKRQRIIRLNGIDAPESGQDFGQVSKRHL
jgi:hypothetical protein